MIKVFVTGDNHFGKKYDRYPDVKDCLIQSRFDSFRNMVRKAEQEDCDLFVVAGDLFDNISTVRTGDVKQVVQILSEFNGLVLVLPGNHDYYTGEEKLWQDFQNALDSCEHNIILLNEFRAYHFELGDKNDSGNKTVTVFPAYCQSKHSRENNLAWIREVYIDPCSVNIGIAHGALRGHTPDIKEEYFLMEENELLGIPVDVWLIGHTHIPYPEDLDTERYSYRGRIFNAGTHEQTDLSNRTEGCCFIITIEKHNGAASVAAKKYISGQIRYFDISLSADSSSGVLGGSTSGLISPASSSSLEAVINNALHDIPENSVVRLRLSGTVCQNDYQDRYTIYKNALSKYLTYEVNDLELSEEISVETIQNTFAQTSFAANFLEKFLDDPIELQMAFQLLQECKEN